MKEPRSSALPREDTNSRTRSRRVRLVSRRSVALEDLVGTNNIPVLRALGVEAAYVARAGRNGPWIGVIHIFGSHLWRIGPRSTVGDATGAIRELLLGAIRGRGRALKRFPVHGGDVDPAIYNELFNSQSATGSQWSDILENGISSPVLPTGRSFNNIAEVNHYLGNLTSSDFFRRRYPHVGPVKALTQSEWKRWGINPGNTPGAVALCAPGRIGRWRNGLAFFDPNFLVEWIVLHELAHAAQGVSPRHGPEFSRIFIELVDHQLGHRAAGQLRELAMQMRISLASDSQLRNAWNIQVALDANRDERFRKGLPPPSAPTFPWNIDFEILWWKQKGEQKLNYQKLIDRATAAGEKLTRRQLRDLIHDSKEKPSDPALARAAIVALLAMGYSSSTLRYLDLQPKDAGLRKGEYERIRRAFSRT